MKTVTFLLISLFCAISLHCVSQEEPSLKARFGLKAGINIANVSVKTSGSFNFLSPKSLIGGIGGVFATLPLSSGFSIQPELLYSMLGFKVNDANNSGTAHINYLVLPVLAKYNIQSSGFAIYAGPQMGVLLSAKSKSRGMTADLKDEIKSTDVSGVFGAEYMFPVGFNISGRYQLGLSNIEKDSSDGSVKNQSVTLTVGFGF